jgi:hypothetical protein
MERIQALPGLSEEHRRDIAVGSESGQRSLADLGGGSLNTKLREGQPKGAADLLVQAPLEGVDRAVVVVHTQALGADQVANSLVVVGIELQHPLVDGESLRPVLLLCEREGEVREGPKVRAILDESQPTSAPSRSR